MTATTKAPLGPTTTTRKWYLDIDSTPEGENPTWVGVFGITEFKPTLEGSLQDDSDFDSNGWKSQTNTANAWGAEGKFKRGVKKDSDPKVYDPGQEIIRIAATKTGVENSVHIRFYEMEPNGPRVEAYEGWCAVGYAEEGGSMEALSIASFTLTGQGERDNITHPATVVPEE